MQMSLPKLGIWFVYSLVTSFPSLCLAVSFPLESLSAMYEQAEEVLVVSLDDNSRQVLDKKSGWVSTDFALKRVWKTSTGVMAGSRKRICDDVTERYGYNFKNTKGRHAYFAFLKWNGHCYVQLMGRASILVISNDALPMVKTDFIPGQPSIQSEKELAAKIDQLARKEEQ